MLKAAEVVDRYYLDVRCMLLEVAATLDRLDSAIQRDGESASPQDPRVQQLYRSLALLAEEDTSPDRAERLLNLFSDLN